MLKTFLNVNVALSNRFTPHALFEARAFQLYDWIGQALILDPAVQTVLDIGAGRTWHFGALKSKRSFRLIGLDDDADELAANPLLDDIIVADASSRLDIPERSVDLILSRATVEHLPNNQTFIENC